MPKYRVFNPGPNHACEYKPGHGRYDIPPGDSIEVDSKALAESLIVDSQGHLHMSLVEELPKLKPEPKKPFPSLIEKKNNGVSEKNK